MKTTTSTRRLRRPHTVMFVIVGIGALFAVSALMWLYIGRSSDSADTLQSTSASAIEKADYNDDNVVDVYDLTALIGAWNTANTLYDLNGDGVIRVTDLSILLSRWGPVNALEKSVGPPSGWPQSSFIQFASTSVFDSSGTGPLVTRIQNGKLENDNLKPTDTPDGPGNPTQRPNVSSNVEIYDDPTATDGKALASWARWGSYETSTGTVQGWTLSRGFIYRDKQKNDWSFPLHIQMRLRAPYANAKNYMKYAMMFWPNDTDALAGYSGSNAWVWELDVQETEGDDKSAWNIAHHIDNGVGKRSDGTPHERYDGAAEQQLKHLTYDMTKWHTMDIRVDAGKTTYWIDGVMVFEVTGADWYPLNFHDQGVFSYGRRLTTVRNDPNRTQAMKDLLLIDYIKVWEKP